MNTHEHINLRQLCLGYFLYSISLKIMALPSLLATGAGNLAWLVALLGSVLEVVLVFIATRLIKHLDQRGKFFRTLCFVFIPIIAAQVWLTCRQVYRMAYTDLSTDLSLFIFILTLILLGSFFITRQPRSFFRTAEIIWLLFALALVIAVVPPLYKLQPDWGSLVQGDYTRLLPTLGGNLLFFESAIFVFIFGAETKKTDRELRRINLTAILCSIGYVVFTVLLVILFGPLLPLKPNAIVDITTSSQFITDSGALDWLIVIATLAALVLRFGLQLVAVATLCKRGCGRHA